MCAAHISLHFSAGFNKTQLATVLEFSSMLSPQQVPKSFDECTDTLFRKYGGKPGLNKNWYCSKFNIYDTLMNPDDRKCSVCGKTLANFIYLPLEVQLIKLIKKFPNVSLLFNLF